MAAQSMRANVQQRCQREASRLSESRVSTLDCMYSTNWQLVSAVFNRWHSRSQPAIGYKTSVAVLEVAARVVRDRDALVVRHQVQVHLVHVGLSAAVAPSGEHEA